MKEDNPKITDRVTPKYIVFPEERYDVPLVLNDEVHSYVNNMTQALFQTKHARDAI